MDDSLNHNQINISLSLNKTTINRRNGLIIDYFLTIFTNSEIKVEGFEVSGCGGSAAVWFRPEGFRSDVRPTKGNKQVRASQPLNNLNGMVKIPRQQQQQQQQPQQQQQQRQQCGSNAAAMRQQATMYANKPALICIPEQLFFFVPLYWARFISHSSIRISNSNRKIFKSGGCWFILHRRVPIQLIQ